MLYIFRKDDGSLVDAPAEFSPENCDEAILDGVNEILVVGKTMVKQTRLVDKGGVRRRRKEAE